MNKTYGSALNEARSLLREAEIAEADLDAWYIMSEVSGFSRIDFWDKGSIEMPVKQEKEFQEMILRRKAHEPVQYILGYTEFCGLRFEVDRNVLIPRQDTEILVEQVMKVSEGKKVLDMCTGSGCIIVTLTKLGKISYGVGADVSENALAVSKLNARNNKADVRFVKTDLFSEIEEKFDIIVSNPPYIESEVIDTLMPEVRDYEPRLALDGTSDGLKFYRRIAAEAKQYLNQGGRLFFEIGCEQAEAVSGILEKEGYADIQTVKDLAGLDRVVSCHVR